MMECLVDSDIISASDKVTGDEICLHYRQRGVGGGSTNKSTLGVLNYCPHPTRSEDHRKQPIQQLQKATVGRIGNGEAIHIVAEKFIFHFRSEDKGGYAAVYPPIEAPPFNILTIENVTSLTDELNILEQSPLLNNQILMRGLSFTLPTVTADSTTIPTATTSVFIYTTEEANLSLQENAIDHPTISDVTSYYVAPIHTKQHKTYNRKKEGGASYANAIMNRGTEQSITRGTTSTSSNENKQQLSILSKEVQALRALISTEATTAAIAATAPIRQDLDREKLLTAKFNSRLTADLLALRAQ
jgi:hypothetical protein